MIHIRSYSYSTAAQTFLTKSLVPKEYGPAASLPVSTVATLFGSASGAFSGTLVCVAHASCNECCTSGRRARPHRCWWHWNVLMGDARRRSGRGCHHHLNRCSTSVTMIFTRTRTRDTNAVSSMRKDFALENQCLSNFMFRRVARATQNLTWVPRSSLTLARAGHFAPDPRRCCVPCGHRPARDRALPQPATPQSHSVGRQKKAHGFSCGSTRRNRNPISRRLARRPQAEALKEINPTRVHPCNPRFVSSDNRPPTTDN